MLYIILFLFLIIPLRIVRPPDLVPLISHGLWAGEVGPNESPAQFLVFVNLLPHPDDPFFFSSGLLFDYFSIILSLTVARTFSIGQTPGLQQLSHPVDPAGSSWHDSCHISSSYTSCSFCVWNIKNINLEPYFQLQASLMLETFLKLGKLQCKSIINRN